MRQDRRFKAGKAVTSRSYARLLSSSLDFLVTADPHLDRWRSLDDIVSTGNTLLAASAALKQAGLPAPVCIAVHALFDADALQRLLAAGVTQVVTCDSIPHSTNAIRLAPLLAKAVLAMAAGAIPPQPLPTPTRRLK